MEEPLEEEYFLWLCAKVLDIKLPNYWDLMRILHSNEFVWLLSGDDNRADDGVELREMFCRERDIPHDEDWFSLPCSLLELFIAFSQRASFQTERSAREWFWEFLTNLHLEEYRRVGPEDVNVISDILYQFVWRTYNFNGQGGMFPMRKPHEDQRKVEIWYQFCDYLVENLYV